MPDGASWNATLEESCSRVSTFDLNFRLYAGIERGFEFESTPRRSMLDQRVEERDTRVNARR